MEANQGSRCDAVGVASHYVMDSHLLDLKLSVALKLSTQCTMLELFIHPQKGATTMKVNRLLDLEYIQVTLDVSIPIYMLRSLEILFQHETTPRYSIKIQS